MLLEKSFHSIVKHCAKVREAFYLPSPNPDPGRQASRFGCRSRGTNTGKDKYWEDLTDFSENV